MLPSVTFKAAMDAAAIPQLEHIYKSITYTCVGQGLLKEGKFFLPSPQRSPKKKLLKIHNKVEKKPAAWWKAQCAFRGLNQSGAISDLQLRLENAKKKMLPRLKDAETQLK
jgi:hypothetical protein